MNGLALRINGGGSGKAKNTCYGVLAVNFPVEFVQKYAQENEIYKQFFASSTADDQLAKLKIILTDGKGEVQQDFIEFLVTVFLEAPAKHPVKCFLTRDVTKRKILQASFASCLSTAIVALTSQTGSLGQFADVTSKLASCIENFPTGVEALRAVEIEVAEYLKECLGYCVQTLSNSTSLAPTEKNEIFNLSHSSLRILLYIVQKVSKDNSAKLISKFDAIRASIQFLLFDEDVPMDTKSVCGILLLTMSLAEDGEEAWKDIVEPARRSAYTRALMRRPAGRLALCAAAAAAAALAGAPALVPLTAEILAVGDSNSSDAAFTLGVTRSILQIAKGLAHVTESSVGLAIIDSMLVFIWSHLEHYMDSVRHLTAQALGCVVQYCSRLEDEGNAVALERLFSGLECVEGGRKSYFVCCSALAARIGARALLARRPGLVPLLLAALSLPAVQACVTTALQTVLRSHVAAAPAAELRAVWAAPLWQRAASGGLDSSVLTVLEDLLSELARADAGLLDHLLPQIKQTDSSNPSDLKCALMLLSVARKSSALSKQSSKSEWKGMIGYDVLKRAAVDAVDETRILSLSLIVESQKSTELFSPGDLDFILYYLKYNINTQSPNFRQLTLSHIKKFIKRFDDSYKVLKRQKEPKILTDSDDYYLDFLERLREQCFDSLLPGSNYSRRFVALQTLVWCENLSLEGYERVWKEDYVEKLLLHLEDSYESNKAYALDILEKCPVDLLQGKKYSTSLEIEDILHQASSLKPTDCTSAAYKLTLLKRKLPHVIVKENESDVPEAATYELVGILVERLQRETGQAERGAAAAAAARAPMYGVLHCLCSLIRGLDALAIAPCAAWGGLVGRGVAAARAAAAAAAPVVNSASPEGHLPCDRTPAAPGDEPINGSQVTAQMVLLCAWRTVKEVSLLLGEISSRLTVEGEGANEDATLTAEQLLDIGQYFTALLAETKHRGAFEQAYVGFTMLLTRLWRCRGEALHGAPARWLHALLQTLRAAPAALCRTRRGAGLPYTVQALVMTELQVSGNPRCFQHCMAELLRLSKFDPAAQYTNAQVETRTHCLNILRALYRNTTLGESAAPYVSDGFLTAINGFDAPTWPERNSSTLLLSALFVRVFGVRRARDGPLCARNRMTGRVFFLRYPALYDCMLSKLREVSSSRDPSSLRPSLYPVLLLLARLYPSALEGTVSSLKLVSLVPLVGACGRSAALLVRRLAARAAPPLLPPPRRAPHLRRLLLAVASRLETNHCHGLLLQIVCILDTEPETLILDQESTECLTKSLKGTLWILEQATGDNACYVIADEYVKVINLILWRFPTLISDNTSRHIESVLQQLLLSEQSTLITSGKDIFLANALYLYFIILYKKSAEETSRLIIKSLLHKSYEVVLSSLNFLLILYQKSDRENFCDFQEHLEAVSDKPELLKLLRNDKNYLENLCHVLHGSKYLECVQKSLKILSLEKDTQSMIVGRQNEKEISKEVLVAELLHRVETEHENVTHMYLDSLLKFVSENLQSMSKDNLLDVVRTVYASSSSENGEEIRTVAVEFLERDHKRLLGVDLRRLREDDSFEYRSTLWSTIVTLLEDDSGTIRQRISNIVSELAQKDTNGSINRVIPSKSAELLRDFVGDYFENVQERIAMIVVLALLDFKSEVCLMDDGNDEARVFDQNERYNIFLEENMWTNECARKIRHFCPEANIFDLIKSIVNNIEYRQVFVKLCNNNFKVFEELLEDKSCVVGNNHDALNPKIALFVSKLQC